MSNKIYCIVNKFRRTYDITGGYQVCLDYFNQQDKEYHKSHKIIEENEAKKKNYTYNG